MKYKKIQDTHLIVSVISLGTWVFGGELWGGSQEGECIQAVSAALEHGINLIDTAPIYGYGRAEEIVGKAIKGKRKKVIIATKCGLIGKGKNIKVDLRPCSIRKEVESSLKRLQVDYIDLYQCHWPDSHTPIQQTMNEMCRLKREGKIRYIGLSNYKVDLIKKAEHFAKVVILQGHYSLLERSMEKDILPYCKERGIGLISYGSLAGGILSGKYQVPPKFKGADVRNFFYKFYRDEEFKRALKIVNLLREIPRPLNQIALNWIRQKEGIVTALVGCRNAEQARMNALSATWELSKEELDKLNSFKL